MESDPFPPAGRLRRRWRSGRLDLHMFLVDSRSPGLVLPTLIDQQLQRHQETRPVAPSGSACINSATRRYGRVRVGPRSAPSISDRLPRFYHASYNVSDVVGSVSGTTRHGCSTRICGSYASIRVARNCTARSRRSSVGGLGCGSSGPGSCGMGGSRRRALRAPRRPPRRCRRDT